MLKEALDDYSNAIERNPDGNGDYYSARGLTYKALSMWMEALTDFCKAIEINPANESYYTNRGNIL